MGEGVRSVHIAYHMGGRKTVLAFPANKPFSGRGRSIRKPWGASSVVTAFDAVAGDPALAVCEAPH